MSDFVQRLPKHISLSIEHNPEAVYYKSVAQWFDELAVIGQLNALNFLLGEHDISVCRETNSVWIVHWNPDTPVGSCTAAGSDLEKLLIAIQA